MRDIADCGLLIPPSHQQSAIANQQLQSAINNWQFSNEIGRVAQW
jgi:hypothetical protein